MNVELEDLGNLKYRARIETDPDALRKKKQALAKAYAPHVNLRGFRPGKAPIEMVVRHLGPALEVEAREALVGEALQAALEERKLRPSTEPSVQMLDDGPAGEVRFTAEFESFPVVDPKDYLGVEVVDPGLPPVREEDVDRVIERMQQRAGRFEPKPQDGVGLERDLAVCKVVLRSEGGELVKEYPETRIVVGIDDEPVVGIGRELLGMRAGEEKSMTGEPGPIAARGIEAEGKTVEGKVVAEVSVRQVLARVLPPVDDEFAKKYAEVADVQAMRDRVRAGLEKARAEQSKDMLRSAVIDAVMKANPVEVGAGTVDRMVAMTEDELKERLLPNMTAEQRSQVNLGLPRDKSEADAREGIARTVILHAIADKEGVEATAEDFEAKLKEIADERGVPLPKVRAAYSGEEGDALRRQIRLEKTMDLLMRYAVVKPAGEAALDEPPARVILTDAPVAVPAEAGRVTLTDAPVTDVGEPQVELTDAGRKDEP